MLIQNYCDNASTTASALHATVGCIEAITLTDDHSVDFTQVLSLVS